MALFVWGNAIFGPNICDLEGENASFFYVYDNKNEACRKKGAFCSPTMLLFWKYLRSSFLMRSPYAQVN